MKLPISKGIWSEDTDQFWFVMNVVWMVQQITDDNIKKAWLVTALQDHSLTWYIKYCSNNPLGTLTETKTTLNKEFTKPKSDLHSIVGFKEITMRVDETPWELDQRLKCVIREANMQITDGQHCEWFIASLLPHLRISLSQQKIGTQAEALEIMMRLHATPMKDATLGVQQIHSQLQSLCLELKILKKDKTKPEVHTEVWCLKCKSQGHDKDHYPIFAIYITRGGPIPLRPEVPVGPSVETALWCAICQVVGQHAIDNCHLLQNFVQTPQQLFYNFCKSVGHDERQCHNKSTDKGPQKPIVDLRKGLKID